MDKPRTKKTQISQLAVQGHNYGQAGKDKKSKENLLQTLGKLEKDAEKRAFEVINLRALVLKLEKEREDSLAAAESLKAKNKELLSSNSELMEELTRVKLSASGIDPAALSPRAADPLLLEMERNIRHKVGRISMEGRGEGHDALATAVSEPPPTSLETHRHELHISGHRPAYGVLQHPSRRTSRHTDRTSELMDPPSPSPKRSGTSFMAGADDQAAVKALASPSRVYRASEVNVELDELRKRVQTLESELTFALETKNQLELEVEKVKALSQNIHPISEEPGHSESLEEVEELKVKLSVLKSELEESQAARQALEKEAGYIKQFAADAVSSVAELTKSKEGRANMSAETRGLYVRVVDLTRQLEASEWSRKAVAEECNQLRRQAQSATQELEQLRAKVKACEEEMTSAAAASAEMTKQNAAVAALEATVAHLTERAVTAEAATLELSFLREQLTASSGVAAAASSDRDVLRTKVADLEGRLAQAGADQDDAQKARAAAGEEAMGLLRSALQAAQGEVVALQAQLQDMEKKLAETEARRKSLDQASATAEGNAASHWAAEKEALQKELEDLKLQLATVVTGAEPSGEKDVGLKEELSAALKEVVAASAQLREVESQRDAAQQQLNDVQAAATAEKLALIKSSEEQLASLKEELETVRADLAAAQARSEAGATAQQQQHEADEKVAAATAAAAATVAAATAELEEVKGKLKDMEMRQAADAAELQRLRSELDASHLELKEMKERAKEDAMESAGAHAEALKLASEGASAAAGRMAEMTALRELLDSSQAAARLAGDEAVSARQRHEGTLEALEALKQEHEVLVHRLAALESAEQTARQRAEEATQECAALTERLKVAEEGLAESRARTSTLSEETMARAATIATLQKDLEGVTADLAEEEAKSERFQVLVTEMARQLELLQDQLAVSNDMNKRLQETVDSNAEEAEMLEANYSADLTKLNQRVEEAELSSVNLRLKIAEQEKELARLKAVEQEKEVVRVSRRLSSSGGANGVGGENAASFIGTLSKTDMLWLQSRLQRAVEVLHLSLPPVLLSKLQGNEVTSLSNMQFFHIIQALLGAVDGSSTSGLRSSGSSLSSSRSSSRQNLNASILMGKDPDAGLSAGMVGPLSTSTNIPLPNTRPMSARPTSLRSLPVSMGSTKFSPSGTPSAGPEVQSQPLPQSWGSTPIISSGSRPSSGGRPQSGRFALLPRISGSNNDVGMAGPDESILSNAGSRSAVEAS